MTPADSAAALRAVQSTDREHFHYRLTGVADPGLLPRVVGLFAKLGLVPGRCLADTTAVDGQLRMTIELMVAGIDPGTADHAAACMRQIYGVEQVLTWSGAASAG